MNSYPSKDLLNIQHINAQSLLSNFDNIEFLISNQNLDIMCISETWTTPCIQSSYVAIPEYSFYRCDGGRGGEVGIYVKNHLNVNVLVAPDIERPPLLEDIWLTIQYRKFPSFILGCVYRHPHALSNTFDYLLDIFRFMSLKN